MAGTIRPDLPTPQRYEPPRNTGQRAFFEAALGRAPDSAPLASAPAVTAAATHRVPSALPTEAPTRILRPGSLLDIRV
jgi:hypothetical protein